MSRDPVRVFYYPEYEMERLTLKKALLFFDEIHLMDRPSFKVTDKFGTVGSASPLRQFAPTINEQGVPFYIHQIPGGPVSDSVYDSMASDLADTEFLEQYQRGLRDSELFRLMQIPPANYGANGTNVEITDKLIRLDLTDGLAAYSNPIEILRDDDVRFFDMSTPRSVTKYLVAQAAVTSLKMNFALEYCGLEGFVPFADSAPYARFLGRKYARAVDRIATTGNRIQLTDLSFAIFDELADSDRLDSLTFEEVFRLRRKSTTAREDFLQYLASLQAKQAGIGPNDDYEAQVRNMVEFEILPAARDYRRKLAKTYDEIYGAVVNGALGALGSGSALTLFGDLSLQKVIAAAGLGGALAGKTAVDAIIQKRAAKRECVISYILELA